MKREVGDMQFKEKPQVDDVVVTPSELSQGPQEDPLRRFTSTPYTAALSVMGRTVRLETNSLRVLQHCVELFSRYPRTPREQPSFTWRIVSQSDVHMSPPWRKRSVFSDCGLRFAEFGQRNFLAVDIEARLAIAFLSEGLVEDEPGFTSPFIDTLFYMTASSLGLVPLAAACVALGTKALLVLGHPNQGKTTASYLAAQGGLTYHADQAVFLEIGSSGLQAWGDFVPPAFRPETLQFLPELAPLTRQFSYCDFNFYYLSKPKLDSGQTSVVTPVCCVVLERESASVPQLVPLPKADLPTWLDASIAFKDDDQFDEQRLRILEGLARLPAYHLAYGSDPATATPFFHRLLTAHGGGDPAARALASKDSQPIADGHSKEPDCQSAAWSAKQA